MSSRLHNGHVRVLLPSGLVDACFEERDLSHFPRHASWNLYDRERNQDQRTIQEETDWWMRDGGNKGGTGGEQVVVDMLRETDSHQGPRKSSHVAEEPSKQENDGLRACERRERRHERTTPTESRTQPPDPRNKWCHIHASYKTRYWLEVHWHILGVR